MRRHVNSRRGARSDKRQNKFSLSSAKVETALEDIASIRFRRISAPSCRSATVYLQTISYSFITWAIIFQSFWFPIFHYFPTINFTYLNTRFFSFFICSTFFWTFFSISFCLILLCLRHFFPSKKPIFCNLKSSVWGWLAWKKEERTVVKVFEWNRKRRSSWIWMKLLLVHVRINVYDIVWRLA